MRLVMCALVVAPSVVLFGLSLGQTPYYTDRGDGDSCLLLAVGWLTVLGGGYSWLANPAILGAWLLVWSRSTLWLALVLACLASGLGQSFRRHTSLIADEGGGRAMITGYGPGYELWCASHITMAIGTLALLLVFYLSGMMRRAAEIPRSQSLGGDAIPSDPE